MKIKTRGPIKFATVCSGIGAPEVAFKRLGWKAMWCSEIEQFPSAVLKHRHSEVKNYGDMTKLRHNKEIKRGSIDVLVGGRPCQSFSVAGLRKGMADPRGNLTLEFLGLIDHLRPRVVLYENVPGLLSSWSDDPDSKAAGNDTGGSGELFGGLFGGGDSGVGYEDVVQTNDFDSFVSGLEELGYGVAWTVLDAQYFGVPQRRQRVFVVAYLGDVRPANAILFDAHCLSGHPPPSRKAGEGVAGTIAARFGISRNNIEELAPPPEPASPIVIDRAAFNQGVNAQYDAQTKETETMPSLVARGPHAVLPPVAFGANDSGQDAREDDNSPTLRAGNHDKSHSNAGTPPAVVLPGAPEVYDMRGNGDGSVVPSLVGDHASRPTDYTPIIFEPRVARNGRGAPEEIAPPLKDQSGEDGRGDSAPVVFKPAHYTRGKDGAPSETCPPVTAEQDRGDTHPVVLSSKPEPLILDEYNQSSDEQCYPLRTAMGDGIPKLVQGPTPEPTTFDLNQVTCPHNRSNPKPGDPCHTLPATTTPPMMHAPHVVRRLTPLECERLQGFPDDYTLIPWDATRRDPQDHAETFAYLVAHGFTYNEAEELAVTPDGPRYKACGNSMAVDVIVWIGQRIQMVEDLMAELAAKEVKPKKKRA